MSTGGWLCPTLSPGMGGKGRAELWVLSPQSCFFPRGTELREGNDGVKLVIPRLFVAAGCLAAGLSCRAQL